MMKRGQTLVASLIVIAIILICAVIFMKGTGDSKPIAKADGRGQTALGNARATAQDEVCKSNLSQVRQLMQVAKASDDEAKFTNVSDIPGAASVSSCPVGKEPYTIDETGKIKCPHPGHGKF
jgi:type II secretory pathway pseudopilin PulG